MRHPFLCQPLNWYSVMMSLEFVSGLAGQRTLDGILSHYRGLIHLTHCKPLLLSFFSKCTLGGARELIHCDITVPS